MKASKLRTFSLSTIGSENSSATEAIEYEGSNQTADWIFKGLIHAARCKIDEQIKAADINYFIFNKVLSFETLTPVSSIFEPNLIAYRKEFIFTLNHSSGVQWSPCKVEALLLKTSSQCETVDSLVLCFIENPGRSLMFPPFRRGHLTLINHNFVDASDSEQYLQDAPQTQYMSLEDCNGSYFTLKTSYITEIPTWKECISSLFTGEITTSISSSIRSSSSMDKIEEQLNQEYQEFEPISRQTTSESNKSSYHFGSKQEDILARPFRGLNIISPSSTSHSIDSMVKNDDYGILEIYSPQSYTNSTVSQASPQLNFMKTPSLVDAPELKAYMIDHPSLEDSFQSALMASESDLSQSDAQTDTTPRLLQPSFEMEHAEDDLEEDEEDENDHFYDVQDSDTSFTSDDDTTDHELYSLDSQARSSSRSLSTLEQFEVVNCTSFGNRMRNPTNESESTIDISNTTPKEDVNAPVVNGSPTINNTTTHPISVPPHFPPPPPPTAHASNNQMSQANFLSSTDSPSYESTPTPMLEEASTMAAIDLVENDHTTLVFKKPWRVSTISNSRVTPVLSVIGPESEISRHASFKPSKNPIIIPSLHRSASENRLTESASDFDFAKASAELAEDEEEYFNAREQPEESEPPEPVSEVKEDKQHSLIQASASEKESNPLPIDNAPKVTKRSSMPILGGKSSMSSIQSTSTKTKPDVASNAKTEQSTTHSQVNPSGATLKRKKSSSKLLFGAFSKIFGKSKKNVEVTKKASPPTQPLPKPPVDDKLSTKTIDTVKTQLKEGATPNSIVDALTSKPANNKLETTNKFIPLQFRQFDTEGMMALTDRNMRCLSKISEEEFFGEANDEDFPKTINEEFNETDDSDSCVAFGAVIPPEKSRADQGVTAQPMDQSGLSNASSARDSNCQKEEEYNSLPNSRSISTIGSACSKDENDSLFNAHSRSYSSTHTISTSMSSTNSAEPIYKKQPASATSSRSLSDSTLFDATSQGLADRIDVFKTQAIVLKWEQNHWAKITDDYMVVTVAVCNNTSNASQGGLIECVSKNNGSNVMTSLMVQLTESSSVRRGSKLDVEIRDCQCTLLSCPSLSRIQSTIETEVPLLFRLINSNDVEEFSQSVDACRHNLTSQVLLSSNLDKTPMLGTHLNYANFSSSKSTVTRRSSTTVLSGSSSEGSSNSRSSSMETISHKYRSMPTLLPPKLSSKSETKSMTEKKDQSGYRPQYLSNPSLNYRHDQSHAVIHTEPPEHPLLLINDIRCRLFQQAQSEAESTVRDQNEYPSEDSTWADLGLARLRIYTVPNNHSLKHLMILNPIKNEIIYEDRLPRDAFKPVGKIAIMVSSSSVSLERLEFIIRMNSTKNASQVLDILKC